MVSNEWCRCDLVNICHLCATSKERLRLESLGQGGPSLDAPRNEILVGGKIAEVFRTKEVCFIMGPGSTLQFHVLNKALLPMLARPTSKTFEELEGHTLCFPPKHSPSLRLLAFHALCAFKQARRRGWISEVDFVSFLDSLDDPVDSLDDPVA